MTDSVYVFYHELMQKPQSTGIICVSRSLDDAVNLATNYIHDHITDIKEEEYGAIYDAGGEDSSDEGPSIPDHSTIHNALVDKREYTHSFTDRWAIEEVDLCKPNVGARKRKRTPEE